MWLEQNKGAQSTILAARGNCHMRHLEGVMNDNLLNDQSCSSRQVYRISKAPLNWTNVFWAKKRGKQHECALSFALRARSQLERKILPESSKLQTYTSRHSFAKYCLIERLFRRAKTMLVGSMQRKLLGCLWSIIARGSQELPLLASMRTQGALKKGARLHMEVMQWLGWQQESFQRNMLEQKEKFSLGTATWAWMNALHERGIISSNT